MAFGDLSPEARATILLQLRGAQAFLRDADKAVAATLRFSGAVTEQGVAASLASKRNFLYAQAIYTIRRYAYFGTLALIGLGVTAAKMGFSFDAAFQTATVSISRFTGNIGEARSEANKLYVFAAKTPFEFNDVALAARRLLPAFNGDLNQTNQLLFAVGNSLAAFGTVSAGNLQRATLALSHMMSIGHVTGRSLQQLAQDNIPLQRILAKEFGVTGQQIHDAVSQGAISAQDAITALVHFMNTEKGFKGAARALASSTLSGAWTTFHDLVAKSFGQSELGIFGRATKALNTINNELLRLVYSGKQLTITDLFHAFDTAFTPGTHRLFHAFITLRTAISDVWKSLRYGLQILNAILWPMRTLTGLFGTGADNAKLYGHFLGILIDLWIAEKFATIAVAIAQGIANLVTKEGIRQTALYRIAKWLAIAADYAWVTALYVASIAQGILTGEITLASIATYGYTAALWLAYAAQFAMTKMLRTLRYAMISLTIAMETNPFILIATLVAALIVGLVILYFKWKWFHDLVNNTYNYIKNQSLGVKLALAIAFGPITTAIAGVLLLIRYWQTLKNIMSTPARVRQDIKHRGGWTGTALRFGVDTLLNTPTAGVGGKLLGMQGGGTVLSSGAVMVGEHGRELVNLPAGAQVTPNREIGNALAGGDNITQPIVVNLMLRERVLEQVVVDIQARRNARR